MSGTTGTVPLQNAVPDQLITSALWNGEFANIGTLLDAAGCGGHSDTDSDTQIQTAPYPGSVLSKATSIAGELERLRYVIAQILGTDYWYKPGAIDLASVGNVIIPIGGIIDYPVPTPPNASWHLADGTAISRAGYPDLFDLIGINFGSGDGTTFNLPNYTDRMAIGAGNLYAVGTTGGEATHILTEDEGAVHKHDATSVVTDPTHFHTERAGISGATQGVAFGSVTADANQVTSQSTASKSTGITVDTTTEDSPGGEAHNNLPPYLAMYKMIRIL
jgi:microcystin-dependent protein